MRYAAPTTTENSMPPASTDPAPVRKRPALLLRLGIGLVLAFVGLVLLIGLEGVIALNAQRFGGNPNAGIQNLPYMAARGVAYLAVSGLLAWAIYRLASPHRRRRYWIALGIASAVLISPAGISLMVYAAVIVISLLGIYR
jgi:uncharacterized BrkB/YihY/UPF0761 family membrane protein